MSWPRLKKKYTEGYDERKGNPSKEKLASLGGISPVWFHAVSVGEVQAAVPIIKAARDAGYTEPIIISTTTETGKAMALRLGEGLFDLHIYYPWDKACFVKSALDAVKPKCFITMETELWPNMLWILKERNIPSFIANGRISDRTWLRLSGKITRPIGAAIYGLFTELFLREERDRQRLISIGVKQEKICVPGDTKIDALLGRRDYQAVHEWKEKFACPSRPIFMAGSTHPGEEDEVLKAYSILRASVASARLIVAPRHPERADAVAALFLGKYKTTKITALKADWDVLIVDRIGVLFELYGLSKAAFVGGSFVDKGGQNILEPASWGVPVQYGPHMEDFAAASREFLALNIASQLADGVALGAKWRTIADEKGGGEALKKQCESYFSKAEGASSQIWAKISSQID